ncbi:MAG: hypothetical protein K0R44_2121, partial [Thermomicrobiales bacterium]|nr:hypothetical protein [Thermomicrobiales bacterium]
ASRSSSGWVMEELRAAIGSQLHNSTRHLPGQASERAHRRLPGAYEGLDDAQSEVGSAGGRAASSPAAMLEALADAGLLLGRDPGPLIGDARLGPAAIALRAASSRGPGGVWAHTWRAGCRSPVAGGSPTTARPSRSLVAGRPGSAAQSPATSRVNRARSTGSFSSSRPWPERAIWGRVTTRRDQAG